MHYWFERPGLALIERIVPGPTTKKEERATVIQYVKRAGLVDRLELSTLLEKPDTCDELRAEHECR